MTQNEKDARSSRCCSACFVGRIFSPAANSSVSTSYPLVLHNANLPRRAQPGSSCPSRIRLRNLLSVYTPLDIIPRRKLSSWSWSLARIPQTSNRRPNSDAPRRHSRRPNSSYQARPAIAAGAARLRGLLGAEILRGARTHHDSVCPRSFPA